MKKKKNKKEEKNRRNCIKRRFFKIETGTRVEMGKVVCLPCDYMVVVMEEGEMQWGG